MKDATPVFAEYDAVIVETQIMPRKDKKAAELVNAFKDNLGFIVEQDLAARQGRPRAVCKDGKCSGNVILLHFVENGYDQNMAQKLFVGDQLRGKLYFIDKQKGTVLREDSLESVESYSDLLGMLHVSMMTKLFKEITVKADADATMARFSKIDPIKPEYKELFRES